MAETYSNPLSNLSYTNKDFQTVFPELLDLVKKLTYKWDPSISNESDPGVILIKLNALLADKLDYNTDQNVLETFPLSVSQDANARQLFYELGYNVGWYKAATGYVSAKIINSELYSEETDNYTAIEPFTTLCDENRELVFTTLDGILTNTNAQQQIRVIQGNIVDYTINNNSLVTIRNLDANNRLYFDDRNVAENGIFILNNAPGQIPTNSADWFQWDKVDNIQLQPINTKCYQFGISIDGSQCYIEFPDDIDSLIGSGIYIKYITTNGIRGNVGKNVISQFFDNVEITNSSTGETYQLTKEDILLYNMEQLVNGTDPETIEIAYKNYKKTNGTFSTLVSLRDYMNYLYRDGFEQGNMCNCIVTDRNTDTQDSYIVNEQIANSYVKVAKIENDTNNEPLIDYFDLKLYATSYVSDVKMIDGAAYNKTFIPCNPKETEVVIQESLDPLMENESFAYFDDTVRTSVDRSVKSIEHNFIPYEKNKFLWFKAIFPIDAKIIPVRNLLAQEVAELKRVIQKALYKALNSHKIDFGEEVTYDEVYNIILSSDDRIKQVALNTFDHYMYGTIYTDYTDDVPYVFLLKNVDTSGTITVTLNDTELSIEDYDINDDLLTIIKDKVSLSIGDTIVVTDISNEDTFTIDENKKVFVDIPLDSSLDEASFDYSLEYPDGYKYQKWKTEVLSPLNNIITDLRIDFMAKCMLTGYTPYFIKDDSYNITINQNPQPSAATPNPYYPITEVSSEFLLNLFPNTDISSIPENIYTFKANEGITFLHPSLVAKQTYGGYVKFFVKDNSSISLEKDLVLTIGENQEIAFFWKESDDDVGYRYVKLGSGNSIRANFSKLPVQLYSYSDVSTKINSLGTQGIVLDTELNDRLKSMVNNSSKNDGFCVLSGQNQIEQLQINMVEYTNKQLPYCVVTNKTEEINGQDYYKIVLQSDDSSSPYSYSYTLKSGEYFLFLDDASQNQISQYGLLVLGDGTQIKLESDVELNESQLTFSNQAIDLEQIVSQGALIFTSYNLPVASIGVDKTLSFIENEFITLSEGTTIAPYIPSSKYTSQEFDVPTSIPNPYTITLILIKLVDSVWVDNARRDSSTYTIGTSANNTTITFPLDNLPTPGSKITVYGYAENDVTVTPFNADSTVLLLQSKFLIYYLENSAAVSSTPLMSWNKLPDLLGDSSLSWKYYSFFNLSMDKDSPQILNATYIDETEGNIIAEDRIYIGDSETPTKEWTPTITQGESGKIKESILYIQPLYPILAPGGNNVNVQHYDISAGTYLDNSFYSYVLDNVGTLEAGSNVVSYVTGDTISITDLTGPFIMQYLVDKGCSIYFERTGDKNITDIFGVSYTDGDASVGDVKIEANKSYYVRLRDGGDSDFYGNITLHLGEYNNSSWEDDYSIHFNIIKLYKVVNTELVNTPPRPAAKTPKLLFKMNDLDVDQNYDYLYEPSEGEFIEDPASYDGFTKPWHLYNDKYICQMYTTDIDKKISIILNTR